MADFFNEWWGIWIAILVVVSILGCALLLWSQSNVKVPLGSDGKPLPVGTTGHVWDGDLTENNHPLPRWWMWLFYITVVFGLGYLALYPGLGSFKGLLGWSSAGAYQQEIKQGDALYGPLFNKYLAMDLKEVAKQPEAHAIGERLFMTTCSQCHGSDAQGSKGFPNLTDNDWLYGGEPATIEETITNGRNGIMPPMGAAVGTDEDIRNVANYVLSLSGSPHDPIKASFGKAKFGVCAACHGPEGKGNQAIGSANLTDKIWLYGGDINTIMETIRGGRNNHMPAHKERLGAAKIHLLAAYVWSLSHTDTLEAIDKH